VRFKVRLRFPYEPSENAASKEASFKCLWEHRLTTPIVSDREKQLLRTLLLQLDSPPCVLKDRATHVYGHLEHAT